MIQVILFFPSYFNFEAKELTWLNSIIMLKTTTKIIILSLLIIQQYGFSQCTLTNATGCSCENGGTTCDLLPDITISWYALENYQSGPTEYSQTGNGANNGKLRLTSSTPNIGFGPLTVRSEDANGNKTIICGTDTFIVPGGNVFTCPNGETPKQILTQLIYQKNGNTMTSREHFTPPMTYSNSSMYVDDWGIFSLRIPLPNDPDPRNWPIIGSGKKRAFCLMDYGSCSTYNDHCRDTNTIYQGGTGLINSNFLNWGLGNGYNCGPTEQGISSGYTDIYSENLDGMWITIPPNTCNGNYWIFYEVDPHNYFEESNENNNFTLIPFTLTLQNSPGNPIATVQSTQVPLTCGTDSVTLMANAGYDFLWSNGATTQNIKVPAGIYTVTVTNYCGTSTSAPYTIVAASAPSAPITISDTICLGDSAQLTASGSNISWYDANDSLVGIGNMFSTPPLTISTNYFAQDLLINPGNIVYGGKNDSTGSGGYFTGSQSLIFTTLKPILLKTVKVYSNSTGTRDVAVYTSTGQLILSGSFPIPIGEYRIPLNFNIPTGTDYRITVNGTPNLWRNNNGVTYPYLIADTLSITGSSAGSNLYYYFYDWEVEVGHSECISPKSLATAKVEVCTGLPYTNANNLIHVYPNPAKNNFKIELTPTETDQNAIIIIYDMTGREVLSSEIALNYGQRFIKDINANSLENGTFMIKIKIREHCFYRRIVIVK